ncbi:purine-cytosine permease family protein [Tsukamurella ocularis]|uniref:purine-cytosine permease family protein n=1 Tax=Tsukamurella ocularis TaxID=1970234 RepID=UPI002168BC55|nr:cytosine permease [Tsukamurella ocularis]MCS3778633.1 purine-cytosine permease-like protein [Tsukamurella ocularis]MCS3789334.1 purine-cytosine permease-like protein [Tsukamurella ocularis]MCS3851316.1 purine-cytosine permease-like protein [Tsukamurella ocularis]
MTPTQQPAPSGAPLPALATAPAPSRPRVEAHGIDVIPDAERHGRARDLFALWCAPNISYLSVVVGGALVLLGLELWQAIAVAAAGCLFSVVTGIVAIPGPASGTPSQVTTRAMYGVRGNRVAIAVNGWFVSVCYIAINWAAAAAVGYALLQHFGVPVGTPVKLLVIAAIATATVTVAIFGQGMISRLYPLLSLLLGIVFLVMSGFVVARADVGFAQPAPLHGPALWAAVLGGVTLVAAAPLSYTISSDFARYLPPDTSPASVATATAFGGAIPGFVLVSVGALAATAVDISDPQAGLISMIPSWFVPVFLVAVIVSTVSNNALTSYSAGLALQSVGVPLSRARAVAVTGVLGAVLTLYALFVSDFLGAVSSALSMLVVLMGPIMAVYVTDIVLRRGRYDGPALSDVSSTSRFWFTGGVNLAGAVSVLAAAGLALLCAHTVEFRGPIAVGLGGIDLSLPVGVLVAAGLYALLTRILYGFPTTASEKP